MRLRFTSNASNKPPASCTAASTQASHAANGDFAYAGVTPVTFQLRRCQSQAQAFHIPLRFPGQYFDAETGMHENWNRYYHPDIGRYLTVEPLLYSPEAVLLTALQGYHMPSYAYALNNPYAFVDVDGFAICLTSIDCCLKRNLKTPEKCGVTKPVKPKPQPKPKPQDCGKSSSGSGGSGSGSGSGGGGPTASGGSGGQITGRAASTRFGQSVQNLKEALSKGKGSWRLQSTHAEGATAQAYRGGTASSRCSGTQRPAKESYAIASFAGTRCSTRRSDPMLSFEVVNRWASHRL